MRYVMRIVTAAIFTIAVLLIVNRTLVIVGRLAP